MIARFALLMVCAGCATAAAQDTASVKLGLSLAEEPHVGRHAPAIVLPYATADSAGPRDQPFDLRKELGHVVVVIFYPGDAVPGIAEAWRGMVAHQPALQRQNVVVVGVAGDPLAAHVAFAREAQLSVKLLSDHNRLVSRRYGVSSARMAPLMVVVVGRGGTVRYVDAQFAPSLPGSYVHLDAAIKAAAEAR